MYFEKLKDLGIELRNSRGQQKVVCPKCSPTRKNKRDTCLSVNVNTGDYNCHNSTCTFRGTVRTNINAQITSREYSKPSQQELVDRKISEGVFSFFKGRKISEETVKAFSIYSREEWMPQINAKTNVICFPYINEKLDIVNIKYRSKDKAFKLFKDAKLISYNLQSIRGKKYAIYVEGEIDCMSLYEAGIGRSNLNVDTETGEVGEDNGLGKWALLSVPNGASLGGNAKLEYLENDAELLMGISEFIIATDNDEAGDSLKKELIKRLGAEKCRTVNYPPDLVVPTKEGFMRSCKDMNEVLIYFGEAAVQNMIINSELIPIEGVYFVDALKESMINDFRNGVQMGHTTRFGTMDEYFRWKTGDINLWVGYGNHGKSTCMMQLMLTKSIYDGWKWAVFSPENFPANDFFNDMIEMYVGKWIGNMTEQEYSEGCDFLNEHIFYVYPDNEHDIVSIHEKFRYLVLKYGVDGVVLDPFNQLDHLQKNFEREDMYISRVLKDIKRFALSNGVVYNIVAHPKTPKYNEDRSLPVVDMYDVAGGAMWGNKVDQIISYYRPHFHTDKNDPNVEIHIQKLKRKRTGGKLGYFTMSLNWKTKRYKIDGIEPCSLEMAKSTLALEARQEYKQAQLISPSMQVDDGFGLDVIDSSDEVPF